MAHIASCIAGPEPGLIQKPTSPAPPALSTTPPTSSPDRQFAWRMLPTDQRKYHLFPRDKPLPKLHIQQTLDPEKAYAVAMGDRNDKQATGAGLRLRVNQHNSARRRKISVPELEPMTTVQEVAMDSPTIPGRPPLHERSSSAPDDTRANLQRTHIAFNDFYLPESDYVETAEYTTPELDCGLSQSLPRQLPAPTLPAANYATPHLQSRSSSLKYKAEAPLPRINRSESSPLSRSQVITPGCSTPELYCPRSASTDTTSPSTTLSTPSSAAIMDSMNGISPQSWDTSSVMSAQSERSATPVAQDGPPEVPAKTHRRGASESGAMLDRGRSRNRTEARNNTGSLLKGVDGKRAASSERRAFEELPKGWRPSEAAQGLSAGDILSLQKQAFGQASRFEVLRHEDVENLSKELRHLDERTDYLRRTYTSLRAGRRNLHSRICQYLRSPRVAKFSHDSMLKQEEALAELDTSIDDWVTKLEQAENRRTRVRQKLLEHVAAASILPLPNSASPSSDSLQQSVDVTSPGPLELSTPPRSPEKINFTSRSGNASPSPQRVVERVPSTILEQPMFEDEESEEMPRSRVTSTATFKRSDVESIRIYAGDDIYSLLMDVEEEISRMSNSSPASTHSHTPELTAVIEVPEEDRTKHERQRSHEQLSGHAEDSSSPACDPSPATPAVAATEASVAVEAADVPIATGAADATEAPEAPTMKGPSTTTIVDINATAASPGAAPTSATTLTRTSPKPLGVVAAAVAAINRDAKHNGTRAISPPGNEAAKDGEIYLTSAVFKP